MDSPDCLEQALCALGDEVLSPGTRILYFLPGADGNASWGVIYRRADVDKNYWVAFRDGKHAHSAVEDWVHISSIVAYHDSLGNVKNFHSDEIIPENT